MGTIFFIIITSFIHPLKSDKQLFPKQLGAQQIRTKKDVPEQVKKKGKKPVFQEDILPGLYRKLSDSYVRIFGGDYPFSNKRKQKEIGIVPGNIDFQNIICLTQEDDITRNFNRYIAVNLFPNRWIPFIPQIKGIVLQEGNELSHMAITCREYEVPCKIIPSFFQKEQKAKKGDSC